MNPEEALSRLAQNAPPGAFRIPPPSFLEMKTEFVDYVEGESLKIRCPVEERWLNPVGFMQGGFIAAAIDNAMGPLSYLLAPPSVTTHLQITYIRPATPDDSPIHVQADLVEKTRSQLHLRAVVTNPDGRILATATASAKFS